MLSSSDRWSQLDTLFHKSLELEPEARSAFLDNSCGEDTELRKELDALLDEVDKSTDILKQPVFEAAQSVVAKSKRHVLDPGTRIGHYEIVSLVATGGMGQVYLAEDTSLQRQVAIKILTSEFTHDDSGLHRLEREARAASALNHPNIVTIHQFGQLNGLHFIASEFVDGSTLRQNLSKGRLDLNATLDIAIQMAGALDAAHSAGIVHRDIKPENVMIRGDGLVKVLDFGIAKLSAARTVHCGTAAAPSSITGPGMLIGTVAYMSPEQAAGKELDLRSDLFSFGAVLYEMTTGASPFRGDHASAILDAILSRPPTPPRQLNPEVPAGMEEIISKALEKDPRARYQHASEIRSDLQLLQRGLDLHNSTAVGELASAGMKSRWRWIPAAALVLAMALFVTYFAPRGTAKLTDKDTVVLADFDNKTGNAVFDDALKQALAFQLGQSPFLNVLSDRKVSQTLQMMGRSANERITADVGGELCLRTGSKALLGGTISSLGSHYLIDLNAVACNTGDTLAKQQAEATSKEDVLKALSRASSSLRTKLGESLPSVQKFDVPIEATTSSLEALKNYSIGIRLKREKGNAPSIPFLKRAIELDPNFPMAYAGLAIAYGSLQQPSLAQEYATKAYQLRDRVSEREKLRISAEYFYSTGEIEKETQTYELWKADYPRDVVPHNNLANGYANMGQYDKALAEFQETLRLAPDNVATYENLALTYIGLNRLEEAKATFDQAFARKLDSGLLRQGVYLLAFLRKDTEQMERQVAWGAGKSGDEDALLSMQSDTESYYGRLNKARDFSRRAVDSAIRADSKETAASWQVTAALRESELGNTTSARQGVAAALALSRGRLVKVVAALTLARTGDASRAKTLVEELEKSYPTNTFLKLYWLPTINAAIELNRGSSSQTLEYLEATAPYELGATGTFINCLYPAYVRGQAYLLANNGTAAAAEFQKMLDHRGIVGNFVTGSLAHLQIGRAYAMAGDTAKAKAAYQDFFNMWRDADPNVPILKQAKVEYVKLQ